MYPRPKKSKTSLFGKKESEAIVDNGYRWLFLAECSQNIINKQERAIRKFFGFLLKNPKNQENYEEELSRILELQKKELVNFLKNSSKIKNISEKEIENFADRIIYDRKHHTDIEDTFDQTS